MQADVVNVRDLGIVPKAGHGTANGRALQRAVRGLLAAGGGTLLIPAGVYEFAETVDVEISKATGVTGALRISGEGDPTLLHQHEDFFVVIDAEPNTSVGHITFEGLCFERGVAATAPEAESDLPESVTEPQQ